MGYCNPEVDELIERQSREVDQERRKRLVWDIERKLAEDGAYPAIYYNRRATRRQPYVKGLTITVTSSTMVGAWKTSGSTNSAELRQSPHNGPHDSEREGGRR
jgi:ABC-type transport system substrate-binding protein